MVKLLLWLIHYQSTNKENKMAKKTKTPRYTYLEVWNTRYGTQERIVTRENGKFIDSTPALATLRKGIAAGR